MHCGQCRAEKRIRIPIMDGLEEQIPPCPDCGWFAWREMGQTVPEVESDSGPHLEGPWATSMEFSEFMKDFNTRQNAYLHKQFLHWREERRRTEVAKVDDLEADRSAMFREVWEILESSE